MKSFYLSFWHRISIWNKLAEVQTQNLVEAEPYLRIIKKLRPSDEERIATRFGPNEQGGITWRMPTPTYGGKLIHFEDEEVNLMIGALQKHCRVVAEGEWIEPLIERLKGESEREPEPELIDEEAELTPV